MTKKLTTAEFIERVKGLCSHPLLFKKTNYAGARESLIITCELHGDFEVKPSEMYRQPGCPCCLHGGKAYKKAPSQKEVSECFISRGYVLLDKYKNSKTPLRFTCQFHREMDTRITYASLMLGCGCKYCGIERMSSHSRKEYYDVKQSFEDAGYELISTSYQNNKEPLEYICTQHGVKRIRYDSFVAGQRCPDCAKSGYKNNKEASLYLLESDEWIKVGITNRHVHKRVLGINRECEQKFVILKEWKSAGSRVRHLENILLAYLRHTAEPTESRFTGYSETFLKSTVDVTNLVSIIEEIWNG